ncbi:uncharacterized protein LOC144913617 [Branchiostoma floridae x Branchiostoma belcheri]
MQQQPQDIAVDTPTAMESESTFWEFMEKTGMTLGLLTVVNVVVGHLVLLVGRPYLGSYAVSANGRSQWFFELTIVASLSASQLNLPLIVPKSWSVTLLLTVLCFATSWAVSVLSICQLIGNSLWRPIAAFTGAVDLLILPLALELFIIPPFFRRRGGWSCLYLDPVPLYEIVAPLVFLSKFFTWYFWSICTFWKSLNYLIPLETTLQGYLPELFSIVAYVIETISAPMRRIIAVITPTQFCASVLLIPPVLTNYICRVDTQRIAWNLCQKLFRRGKKFIQRMPTRDPFTLHCTVDREVSTAEGNCVVCHDDPVAVTLVPCGHRCLCRDCGLILTTGRQTVTSRKCPLDRGPITSVVDTHDFIVWEAASHST